MNVKVIFEDLRSRLLPLYNLFCREYYDLSGVSNFKRKKLKVCN